MNQEKQESDKMHTKKHHEICDRASRTARYSNSGSEFSIAAIAEYVFRFLVSYLSVGNFSS